MWRTPLGERTLSGAEAALIRRAVASLADTLLEEAEGLANRWLTGVALFDELSWPQRLALLENVASALLDPASPAPELSAVNEAAVGAVLAIVRQNIEIEIDMVRDSQECDMPSSVDLYAWRRALALCQPTQKNDNEFCVDVESTDMSDWDLLIDCVASDILWDDDWDIPGLFMDVDPDVADARRVRLGIERNYYTLPAPDASDQEVAAIFKRLQNLVSTSS